MGQIATHRNKRGKAAAKTTAKTGEKPRQGRPSPRPKDSVRQSLIMSQETADRLTMAIATEKIRRERLGEKVDKSLIVEEIIIAWLDKNKF